MYRELNVIGVTRRTALALTMQLATSAALAASRTVSLSERAERHKFLIAVKELQDQELKEIEAALHKKGIRPVLGVRASLIPFGDWDYYFVSSGGSISWEPNSPDQPDGVEVPAGFVTDLASIPRLFWQVLKPAERHAYAAVVHDFLYWEQTRSRDQADLIFKIAMEDSGVHPTTVRLLYLAVRALGKRAWQANAGLKKQGERRVLMQTPTDFRIGWKKWKLMPDVFDTPRPDVEVPPSPSLRSPPR